MSRAEMAEKLHGQGFNCAQAVFAAYADAVGLELETSLRVSAGLGGGIGRSGNVCGAVSGALMVLGMKHGMVVPGDLVTKERMYAIAQDFMLRFQQRHHTLLCRELIGVDMSKPGWRELSKERNTSVLCNGFIRDATAILDEMLKEG